MAITQLNNRSINRSDTAASGQLWTATSATASDFQAGSAGTAVFKLITSGAVAVANQTHTKITWTSATYDTASGVDTTNNRWTVPSGYDGDYFLFGQIFIEAANAAGERADLNIRINNTARISTRIRAGGNPGGTQTYHIAGIYRLNATDYVELFIWHDQGGSVDAQANEEMTWLKGFKLNSE